MLSFTNVDDISFFDSKYFNIVCGIIGGILGFWFKTWLIGYQVRTQDRGKAITNLRNAFTPIRKEFEEISSKDSLEKITIILEKHHNTIREAMIKLEYTISIIRKRRIRKRWFKYCKTDYRNINKLIRYYHHSFKKAGENKTTIKTRDAVLKSINNILKLAK